MSRGYQKHVDDGFGSCNCSNASAKGASCCNTDAAMAICAKNPVAIMSFLWDYLPAEHEIESIHLGPQKRDGPIARSSSRDSLSSRT